MIRDGKILDLLNPGKSGLRNLPGIKKKTETQSSEVKHVKNKFLSTY